MLTSKGYIANVVACHKITMASWKFAISNLQIKLLLQTFRLKTLTPAGNIIMLGAWSSLKLFNRLY